MSKTMRLWILSSVVVTCVLASVASAQVAPSLGYAFPPAVERGKSTQIQLGGFDFTPDLQVHSLADEVSIQKAGELSRFFVPEPPYWFGLKGFSAAYPIPREIAANITVSANQSTGIVFWQVTNANGASSPACLFVSDRPEVVEERWRDSSVHELPTLPIGVSGRIRRISEIDQYSFVATKSGPITLELMARQLGSNFNAVIEVRDSNRKLIADVADTEGRDPSLTFLAKSGQRYIVRIFDLDYRGNRSYVYRLAVTETPRVIATIPAYGEIGTSAELQFIGYGVATGQAALESISAQVEFVEASVRRSRDGRRVVTHALKTKFGTVNVDIPVSKMKELSEPSPNETLRGGTAVTGALSQGNVVDRFAIDLKKGESVAIFAEAQSIGSSLDVSFDIRDPSGTIVARGDDSAADASNDASTTFRAKLDGRHILTVKDDSGKTGSLNSIYRISMGDQLVGAGVTRRVVAKEQAGPDFSLSLPQTLAIDVKGTKTLPVKVKRAGSFTGSIALRVEGLPQGLSVEGQAMIPEKKNTANITIKAGETTGILAGHIRVIGTAMVDGTTIERTAVALTTANLAPRVREENVTDKVMVFTQMKPPFSLLLVDRNRQRVVNRGTTYPAPFQIKRDAGFAGEIQILMRAAQSRHRQGISGPILAVAPDQDEALYPCFMPEWLATDRTTRMQVMGMAKVKDPAGKTAYLTKSADARITMILDGRLMKVTHSAGELTVLPGSSFEIPIQLTRTAQFQESVQVELHVPKPLQQLVKAKPVSIAASVSKTTLHVTTTADERMVGDWELTIKCRGLQDNKWPVVTQTTVPIRFAPSTKTVSAR